MNFTTLPLLDYHIYIDDISKINYKNKQLISTINQYSYCIAERDSVFKRVLQKSEILLPDGIGIVIAANLLKKQKIKKIAGADIHKYLLEQLEKSKGKCMYLGSSENTLKKIQNRLQKEYPNIECCTYSPPYKSELTKEDNERIVKVVNEFEPDVLFVGMTAPKQEKWSLVNKDRINTRTICCIGAVFDFYAGTIKRPSDFWIKLNLEWFIRLIKEPKRMWRRYLYYGPFFIFSILKHSNKK